MSASVFSRPAMSQDPPAYPIDPSPSDLVHVRRALFGPVSQTDRAAYRQFAENELNNQRESVSQHYDFDFVTCLPLNSENAKYRWSRVENTDRVPEAYAMTHLPFLSAHADGSLTDSGNSASSSSSATNTVPADTTTTSVKQSKLTSYLKKRKRGNPTAAISEGKIVKKKSKTITPDNTTST